MLYYTDREQRANNNNQDNIYGAIIMAQSHCKSSLSSFDECRLSAEWPLTLRPSQPTSAASPPKIGLGSYRSHLPMPFITMTQNYSLLLLSPKTITHFRVRANTKILFFRTFEDLQRPSSRVFQDSQNSFSRTFQDIFGSKTWLHNVQKVHTQNQLSV